MKSIGFKEWAIVCEALGEGRQNVILRKGGIAEGRDGFAFRHREFFLFPTFFHEQIEKTRLTDAIVPQPNELQVTIRFFARMEHARRIESWETVAGLECFHVLKQSVVQERFDDGRAPGSMLHSSASFASIRIGFCLTRNRMPVAARGLSCRIRRRRCDWSQCLATRNTQRWKRFLRAIEF